MNLNKSIMDLTVLINPFESLYIPNHIKNKISKIIHTNIPSRFLDAYEIVKENISKITDRDLRDKILPWMVEFEGMIEDDIVKYFSKYILNLRTNRKTPSQISKNIYENFNLQTYSGDIYSYLENSIKVLDAIERIGGIYNKNISNEAKEFKEKISNPYKYKKRKLKYKK
jgi:helicase